MSYIPDTAVTLKMSLASLENDSKAPMLPTAYPSYFIKTTLFELRHLENGLMYYVSILEY